MGLAAFNRARRLRAEEEAREREQKPIDKMTVPELKEYAAANGIDLGEATKKDEILAVIKGGE